VLGESVTRADAQAAPAQARAGIAGLPVTGARLLALAAAGLLLLLGGVALVRLARRHREHTVS
jgi:LPXTG-motif cell wall-anchored protein